MKILVAGSSGMIGSATTRYLIECNHEVIRLVRHEPNQGEVWWSPDSDEIDTAGLEGFDGVVHLATMQWPMRWTGKAKKNLRANRLGTNRLLAESLAKCKHKPKVLICASGMGYYPSSGETILTEKSPAGKSFLAKLQQDGEAITAPASDVGIRVIHLRIPPIMGGRALQQAGFMAGVGHQWVSWVSLDEIASIIEFALRTDSLTGSINAVSPNPMRKTEFSQVLTKTLGKKSGIVMPDFIMHLLMGEMGEELLLASRRIQPVKLIDGGYTFCFPELEMAVRHEMENSKIQLAG